MKNVLVVGSTGMVGRLVLEKCLQHPEVNKVTAIVRKTTGKSHPKLVEVVHEDFSSFSNQGEHFKQQDICFYCVGVYAGKVSKEMYRTITVDYLREFAETVRLYNQQTTFCYLSAGGADIQQKSKMRFAREKGAAEKFLIQLNFEQTYLFRPAYIFPTIPRKEPGLIYLLSKWFYKPIISKLGPDYSVTSQHLADVMVDAGFRGMEKIILENRDIVTYQSPENALQ